MVRIVASGSVATELPLKGGRHARPFRVGQAAGGELRRFSAEDGAMLPRIGRIAVDIYRHACSMTVVLLPRQVQIEASRLLRQATATAIAAATGGMLSFSAAYALDASGAAKPPEGSVGELRLVPPAKIGETKAATTPPETPDSEFRTGSRLYFQGNPTAAVEELNRAAERGHPGALYLLGRMYRTGDGVPTDDLKAFGFFARVAEDHDSDRPDSPSAAFVASSYVALGSYYMTGIKGSEVRPNVDRAREIFTYAASQYGDADAQLNLGRLYLAPNSEQRSPKLAAKWLNVAAKKGQVEAQALLGQLLFTGDDDVPRRAVQGLMWLTIARQGAHGPNQDWIAEAQEQAFSLASEQERRQAMNLSQSWIAKAAAD
jgi:TPR repeat protein